LPQDIASKKRYYHETEHGALLKFYLHFVHGKLNILDSGEAMVKARGVPEVRAVTAMCESFAWQARSYGTAYVDS